MVRLESWQRLTLVELWLHVCRRRIVAGACEKLSTPSGVCCGTQLLKHVGQLRGVHQCKE